jgi:cupin superfamily acireductone dioxygenase involved in methionine salvage
MNEKILHILNEDMYIIIHIPKGIYHVVPFRIAQSCGIKDSSHFVKVRLFGAGCRIKLKRWLGKQNESGLNINGFHQK